MGVRQIGKASSFDLEIYGFDPCIPDREDWFNSFWITCAERMKETPYRKDFVKLCKTKEASSKEDMLKKQIGDTILHEQTEQHQHMLVKRIQQEHEARMREQEAEMFEKLQKKQLEADQDTQRKIQQMETEMRNKLKIELLEEMKGKKLNHHNNQFFIIIIIHGNI